MAQAVRPMGALSDGPRYARAAQEEASILALSYLPTTDTLYYLRRLEFLT